MKAKWKRSGRGSLEDFTIHTRAKTLKSFHSYQNTLRKTAKELMTEFIEGMGKCYSSEY